MRSPVLPSMGRSVGKVSSYTFSNVTASHTINATFAALNYTLTISKAGTGSGTVANSPSGTSFPAGTSREPHRRTRCKLNLWRVVRRMLGDRNQLFRHHE